MPQESTPRAAPIPSLDGLRGLAAMTVVVSHFSNRTRLFGGLLGEGAGQVGVMLFFALSGYLMGKLYLEQRLTWAHLATFFRRRAARVLPLYYGVVLLSFVLSGVLALRWVYPVNRGNLLQHLLMVGAESVLWTIPVEIRFYAVFPLFWAAYRGSPVAATFGTAAIAIWCLSGFAFVPTFAPWLTLFLAGLLVSRISTPPASTPAFGALLVLYVLLLPQVWLRLGLPNVNVWASVPHVAMIAALLLLSVRSPLAVRLLANPVARYLGKISYSLYLLHLPAIYVAGLLLEPRDHIVLFGLAVASLSLSASTASYFLLERPTRTYLSGRN